MINLYQSLFIRIRKRPQIAEQDIYDKIYLKLLNEMHKETGRIQEMSPLEMFK